MSVYTEVSQSQLEGFLKNYDIGTPKDFQAVADGIENTTYFVTTQDEERMRRFVLTLFERQDFDDLPYFVELMCHAHKCRLPCATPVPDKNGEYLQNLNHRPAIFTHFLDGETLTDPARVTDTHRAEVGKHLACLHSALCDFPLRRANNRGLDWCSMQAKQVFSLLQPGATALLKDEIAYQSEHPLSGVPSGTIHSDLFRDNVLFNGETLNGLIDFYYACDGAFIYDLAVTVNDWCRSNDGTLAAAQSLALTDAYQAQRPLNIQEIQIWPVALRMAALRFWVSRLADAHFPRDGHTTHCKDPTEFQRLLEYHRTGNTPI